tara:strand:+ start:934 stop:1125 length:192 start_codon:yes stop_codon:yes gene_type:complete
MTEEGYLMTDETSHDLQNRIDGVLDLIDFVRVYDNELKIIKEIMQKLRGIRDDIPCTCGEEVE